MLKLHNIFFRKFVLLFSSIFIILGFIVYIWVKNIYIDQIKLDLLHNIDIISLNIKDFNNIDQKAKDINKKIGLRVTIIDKDGIVIGESHKDKSLMNNHKNRAEIISSKYEEYGFIIRKSDSINKKLLYVAKKFTINSEDYFIRMARDINQINEEFLYLSLKIGLLFCFYNICIFSCTKYK